MEKVSVTTDLASRLSELERENLMLRASVSVMRGRERAITIAPSEAAMKRLRTEGLRRGMTANVLACRILETVCADNLIKAVVDE